MWSEVTGEKIDCRGLPYHAWLLLLMPACITPRGARDKVRWRYLVRIQSQPVRSTFAKYPAHDLKNFVQNHASWRLDCNLSPKPRAPHEPLSSRPGSLCTHRKQLLMARGGGVSRRNTPSVVVHLRHGSGQSASQLTPPLFVWLTRWEWDRESREQCVQWTIKCVGWCELYLYPPPSWHIQ